MTTANLKAWLLNPAFLLALVPLVKFVLEFLYRRWLGGSTLESLNRAATSTNSTVDKVKEAVKGPSDDQGKEIRKALAGYVDNIAKLEKFFETCAFTALSLGIWWLTEQHKQGYQKAINLILLFVIIFGLLIVGIRSAQNKYDFASKDEMKNTDRFAFGLNLVVVILESVLKLTGQ